MTRDRYCPTHANQHAEDELKRWQRNLATRRRASASGRGYGSAWQAIRREVLGSEPNCRRCGAAAVDVDHIISIRNGGTNDLTNLQPLCRRCHLSKTQRQQAVQA